VTRKRFSHAARQDRAHGSDPFAGRATYATSASSITLSDSASDNIGVLWCVDNTFGGKAPPAETASWQASNIPLLVAPTRSP